VLSPVAWRTPPRQYGAWETVASNIAEGLIARGWDVTLFATGTEVASNDGWQYKVSFVLLLIASLNIFVGAFNLLPLLPLDGGHIAVIIYERIRAWLARLRGRPDPGLADMAKFLPVSFSVFIVLIVLSLALVAANIINPVNLTGG